MQLWGVTAYLACLSQLTALGENMATIPRTHHDAYTFCTVKSEDMIVFSVLGVRVT